MAKALKIAGMVVVGGALILATAGVGAGLIAGASLAGAVGAVAGGTLIAGLGLGSLLAIGAGLTLGASLLAPKPKAPQVSSSTTDRLSASIVLRAPRTMVFGRTAMATDIRDQELTADQVYLHRWMVVASHRAAAIEELWLDDKQAWTAAGGVTADFAGYLSVTPVLEGSAANAINVGARMGSTRRYTGCAYLYLRFRLTGTTSKVQSPFASSVPSRTTIIGKGAAVYDPRLDTSAGGFGEQRATDQATWAWDDAAARNPALQLLAYLLGWRINDRLAVGKGIPAARLDLASFMTAANLCDEPVARAAGGTEPRYRSDGIFSENDDLSVVLDSFKASMNATLDDVDGKIRVTVLHNDLAAPIGSLFTKDVLGDFTWTQTPPLSDSFNVVRGGYTDPSTTSLYQLVDYPEVAISSPDGIERVQTVTLPLVQSPSQAQRLAKTRLQRALYGGMFQATFQATAWKFQKGDVIRLSFAPLGWGDKLFRIADMTVQIDGTVPMMLREEHPAIYAWDASDAAAVSGVEPTRYDPALAAVVLAIGDASRTAEWDAITDPTGTKPDDNADVTGENTAADTNAVGGRPSGEVLLHLTTIDQAIANVRASIDGTEVGAAQAALDARDASIAAAGNSAAARDQSQVARDAAQAAKVQADTAAATSAQRAQDANGSAVTASGQAAIAVQKADAAGQSASLASARADIAATKAGEASTSAQAAATSRNDAAGSATSAALSQTVAASSARSTVLSANAPISFAQKGALYADQPWTGGTALPDSAFVAASTGFVYSKSGYYCVAYAKLLPAKGRLYRLQAKLRAVGTDATYSPDFELGNNVGGPEYGTFGGYAALPVSAGWVTLDFLIDLRTSAYAFLNAHVRGSAGGGGTVEVEYFRCIDVTDQQAAADQASAAATSAQSAATARTAAGDSASAAQNSATTASTKASQASTSANSAATSETNAAGSAATASTQAGLAAQSANAAGGSATAANTSAGTASTKADAAGASASAANQAKLDAQAASGAAQGQAGVAQQQAAIANDRAAAAVASQNVTAQYRDQAQAAAASANSSSEAVTSAGGALAQRVDAVEVKANGASASASTTAQAVSDVKTGLAGARLALVASSAGGQASVTIQSDSANGQRIRLVGAVDIAGDLTVDGTISSTKFDASTMARIAEGSWSGSVSGTVGGAAVPFSLTLPAIYPRGRFLIEAYVALATNAGQQSVQ